MKIQLYKVEVRAEERTEIMTEVKKAEAEEIVETGRRVRTKWWR